MSDVPKYFMYFPGNYRWSSAFVNMLGMAPYGGSDISEVHKIGSLLHGKAPDDDAAWFDACRRVAEEVRGDAQCGPEQETGEHPEREAARHGARV